MCVRERGLESNFLICESIDLKLLCESGMRSRADLQLAIVQHFSLGQRSTATAESRARGKSKQAPHQGCLFSIYHNLGIMNGPALGASLSRPQPIIFFGSRLPFDTSNHGGRAPQTHTKTHAHACTYSRAHTHFACLCSFHSLYRDEKGSVTGCVKNHVTWLGCAWSGIATLELNSVARMCICICA